MWAACPYHDIIKFLECVYFYLVFVQIHVQDNKNDILKALLYCPFVWRIWSGESHSYLVGANTDELLFRLYWIIILQCIFLPEKI